MVEVCIAPLRSLCSMMIEENVKSFIVVTIWHNFLSGRLGGMSVIAHKAVKECWCSHII